MSTCFASKTSPIMFRSVKKRTSPVIATSLSMICPGLGAAYNGQTVKALVYFAIFAGLFQMAVLTSGTPLFVLGLWGCGSLPRSMRGVRQIIRSGPDARHRGRYFGQTFLG